MAKQRYSTIHLNAEQTQRLYMVAPEGAIRHGDTGNTLVTLTIGSPRRGAYGRIVLDFTPDDWKHIQSG